MQHGRVLYEAESQPRWGLAQRCPPCSRRTGPPLYPPQTHPTKFRHRTPAMPCFQPAQPGRFLISNSTIAAVRELHEENAHMCVCVCVCHPNRCADDWPQAAHARLLCRTTEKFPARWAIKVLTRGAGQGLPVVGSSNQICPHLGCLQVSMVSVQEVNYRELTTRPKSVTALSPVLSPYITSR